VTKMQPIPLQPLPIQGPLTETENPATDGGPREPSTKRTAFSIDPPEVKRLLQRQIHTSAFVLPWENRERFERLRIRLAMELKPVGVMEQVRVDQIAGCIWRLEKCQGIESGITAIVNLGLFAARVKKMGGEASTPYDLTHYWPPDAEDVEGSPPTKSERNGIDGQPECTFRPYLIDLALAFISIDSRDPLARVQQLEKHINDVMHRAQHELERLQARRRAPFIIPTAVLDLDYSDIDDELERRRAARNNPRPGRRKQTRATRLNQQTKEHASDAGVTPA